MLAAPSSLSSAAAAAPSHLNRLKPFRRSSSFPRIQTARSPRASPRSISASSACSAAERPRERTGDSYHFYSWSRIREEAAAAAGTLYDVLGLPAGATAQEIKAAFRRLARERHPDAAAAGRKRASAEEFMRIHAAYATLSDPSKRTEYDRRMAASTPRRRPPFPSSSPSAAASSHYNSPSPASSGGFGRRTWETDQCW